MEKLGKFFVASFLFSLITVSSGHENKSNSNVKLFFFGDSFLDTGNFNGRRSSDGLMLTDYIASFFGTKTPGIRKEKDNPESRWYGVNFAYTGSGVSLDAFLPVTMTLQIDEFEKQIDSKYFTISDVENSVAVVSYTGNEYAKKLNDEPGNLQGFQDMIPGIVNELGKSLQRIGELRVRKIGIFGVPPRGCSPGFTASINSCNETLNEASSVHNQLLQEAVQKLNKDNNEYKIVYLDIYGAILSFIDKNKGIVGYENPLKPCRQKLGQGTTTCEHPELSLFWDTQGHPSQNGANAICSYLKSSLRELL